jgi:hypothetical protein
LLYGYAMKQLPATRPTTSSMLSALTALVLGWVVPNVAFADVWRWQGEIEEPTILDIELVRGHVRVERAPRAGVEIEAVVSDPKISLRVAPVEGQLRVRDFYRVRPVWFPMHECLPPPGEHGDFADGSGKVEVVVYVPPSVVVQVRVLAEY